MATQKQQLGEQGEKLVVQYCSCPRCKREKTLKRLPRNFKCADIVCDFCGYLTQVKTKSTKNIDQLPNQILGGAWGPQQDRMHAGIYFSLYLVLTDEKSSSIYYLPADLQLPEMFVPRKPLSENAKRAGWQGFLYDLTKLPSGSFIRLK